MRLLLGPLLFCAWAAALLVGAEDATLHFIDDPTGKSKCLDGSPTAFYHRPGHGSGLNKWLISYEGGGWCGTLDDCLGRSTGPLGSSKEYKPTASMLLGKMTADPNRNPTFWNHNVVLVKYCDGGFYSGDVAKPVVHKNTTLYFRGRHIHAALVDNLMELGLGDATDIVISGCSAGAVQTMINLDYIKSLLPKQAHVVGLPDSGFLVEYDGPGACQYKDRMAPTLKLMNVSASLPKECLAKFAPKDQWRCMFFAQHIVPYIETEMFVLQSKYDYWQMDNNIYCELINIDNARTFGAFFEQNFLEAFGDSSSVGYLLDSCTHHCGGWDFIGSDDGLTQHSVFEAWYQSTLDPTDGGAGAPQHKLTQKGTFPCLSCCVQGVWGQFPPITDLTPHVKQQEVGSSGGDRLGLGKEAVAAAQRRQQRRLQDSELASMKEIMKLMVEVKEEVESGDEDDKAGLSLPNIVQSFVPLPKPMDGKEGAGDSDSDTNTKSGAAEIDPSSGAATPATDADRSSSGSSSGGFPTRRRLGGTDIE